MRRRLVSLAEGINPINFRLYEHKFKKHVTRDVFVASAVINVVTAVVFVVFSWYFFSQETEKSDVVVSSNRFPGYDCSILQCMYREFSDELNGVVEVPLWCNITHKNLTTPNSGSIDVSTVQKTFHANINGTSDSPLMYQNIYFAKTDACNLGSKSSWDISHFSSYSKLHYIPGVGGGNITEILCSYPNYYSVDHENMVVHENNCTSEDYFNAIWLYFEARICKPWIDFAPYSCKKTERVKRYTFLGSMSLAASGAALFYVLASAFGAQIIKMESLSAEEQLDEKSYERILQNIDE
eukprot:jgi/Bigna1/88933/estExt_fgenesh1_pg.C_400136